MAVAVLATVIGLCAGGTAQALPITGSISFGGAASPAGGTNWGNATGVIFTTATVGSSPLPSGIYLGTDGMSVTFSDFTFNPFPGAGVTPLWSFTSGANTYSFDLMGLSGVTLVGNDTVSSLMIKGSGMLSATGFDPTPGLFILTAQGFGAVGTPVATYSFSASNIANSVPEPGSLLLLGTGLFGLAGAVRRRIKK